MSELRYFLRRTIEWRFKWVLWRLIAFALRRMSMRLDREYRRSKTQHPFHEWLGQRIWPEGG